MAAYWSTRAWTVEASRVTIRSTHELARLFAMAVPFEVNSSVMLRLRVWTESVHVMVARGIRTAARNRMIFASNPNRGFAVGALAACSGSAVTISGRVSARMG